MVAIDLIVQHVHSQLEEVRSTDMIRRFLVISSSRQHSIGNHRFKASFHHSGSGYEEFLISNIAPFWMKYCFTCKLIDMWFCCFECSPLSNTIFQATYLITF